MEPLARPDTLDTLVQECLATLDILAPACLVILDTLVQRLNPAIPDIVAYQDTLVTVVGWEYSAVVGHVSTQLSQLTTSFGELPSPAPLRTFADTVLAAQGQP